MPSKIQKITLLDFAASLGFSNKPFKFKKGPKAGQIDEKKVVLVRSLGGEVNVRLAALRAIGKVRPLGIKKGSQDAFIFFTRASLERKVSVPSAV